MRGRRFVTASVAFMRKEFLAKRLGWEGVNGKKETAALMAQFEIGDVDMAPVIEPMLLPPPPSGPKRHANAMRIREISQTATSPVANVSDDLAAAARAAAAKVGGAWKSYVSKNRARVTAMLDDDVQWCL